MEKFNFLDLIAKIGETVLKNSSLSQAEATPPKDQSAANDQPPSAPKNNTPPAQRVQSDGEKAMIELIKRHDARSKAIDERVKNQTAKQ